ncbi:MAG: four helix bundle protein [Burkholderiales bacterium]|nr:four helix bundle protein [Bacteroidia bacterium]
MATILKFEDIIAWQKALELSDLIYTHSNNEKFSKDFGLKDQMRRASVSVVSNIAEGFEREGNNQFIYFLLVAKASTGELRAQLYIARNQKYNSSSEFDTINNKVLAVSKTISGFTSYLRTQKKSSLESKKLSKLS